MTQVLGGQAGVNAVAVDDGDAYVSCAGTEGKQYADGIRGRRAEEGRNGQGPPLRFAPGRQRAGRRQERVLAIRERGDEGRQDGRAGDRPRDPRRSVDDLALDDAYVYFASHKGAADGAEISRVPKEGGAVEVLASGQSRPAGIAVDPSAVYWSCLGTEDKKFSDGTLSKRDKP